jgi:serine protease Do
MHTRRHLTGSAVAVLSSLFLLLLCWNAASIPAHAGDEVTGKTASLNQATETLRDLNRAYAQIADEVRPAVVTVSTERVMSFQDMPFGGNSLFEQFFNYGRNGQAPQEQEYHQRGLGSGIIMSPDGMILTNNHVIDEADSIYVRTYDGHRYTAKVLGVDPQTDIAVIKIDAENLTAIPVGNSDDLRAGDIVLAVGSPMSENLAYSVTQGIVSATSRSNMGLADYEDFIQTDAAINPGNSGGPLVNINGELVGINTAIASRTGGFQGIGFAVPSNLAVHEMNSLVKEGKVVRGWLGVSIQNLDEPMATAMGLEETRGALIGDVLDGSPASAAGLKAGDLVEKMDDHVVQNSAQLRNRIASAAPGTAIRLTILRDGTEKIVSVTLGELPSRFAEATPTGAVEEELGFRVSDVTGDLAKQFGIEAGLPGVVVIAEDPASHAAQAGLKEGDLIVAVDRHEISNVSEFTRVVSDKKAGDTTLLRVRRGDSGFFLAFQV